MLLTGTGVVPEEGFMLAGKDVVTVSTKPIGELVYAVQVVGRDRRAQGGSG